jgi:chemotaxis protein methyltransferase CheR
MPGVSIIEAKNIIRTIHLKYGYDFSNYVLTALRYKFDKVLMIHHTRDADILINRLLEDKAFFDEFLYDISVPTTELFRDAEMWNLLKTDVIPQLTKISGRPVIWFPDAVEGKELYSFLMLAHFENLEENLEIVVSSLSDKSIFHISNGYYNSNSMELGFENFKKIYPGKDITIFLKKKGIEYFFDSPLLRKIKFQKQDMNHQPMPEKSTIIFFRNKFLNYTIEYQNFILASFVKNIESGGFLIIGDKENIDEYLFKEKTLKALNDGERIYIKH